MESSIIIKPRNKKEASLLKKILEALDAKFILKDEQKESLSPSDDPYFDNQKNIDELQKRLFSKDKTNDKEVILRTKEDIKNFLGL